MSTLLAEKRLYLALDETGEPQHCASWPEACHEHINDAINEHKLDEAARWVVREVRICSDPPQMTAESVEVQRLEDARIAARQRALSGLRCMAIWLRSIGRAIQAEDLEAYEKDLK